MDICIASNNPDKIAEIYSVLSMSPISFTLFTINEIVSGGFEVEEDGKSIEDNAYIKAIALYKKTGMTVIADDTGLEVEVLGGKPGVYSARYAGDGATYSENVNYLLEAMKDFPNQEQRLAQFRTVICCISPLRTILTEGMCTGYITTTASGTHGFGYDPIFLPDGYAKTFAEMDYTEKNMISHRSTALRSFISLFEYYNS